MSIRRCTYCGEPADSLDHVIPQSMSDNRRYDKKVCVPCCRDCNSTLGAVPFTTVGTRAAYLNGKYKTRFKRVLDYPDWDEDELAEMGYNMRKQIKQGQLAKATAIRILEHTEYVALVSPTIAEVWQELD